MERNKSRKDKEDDSTTAIQELRFSMKQTGRAIRIQSDPITRTLLTFLDFKSLLLFCKSEINLQKKLCNLPFWFSIILGDFPIDLQKGSSLPGPET